MIPKIIHYCWFGGKRKPKLIKDCIASWKSLLPDYEIIEWNEKNCDLSNEFVCQAYKLNKWAFVSDYIRLKVLYENGGIYLDTDMMVIKPFDSLLFSDCFFGAEDSEFISCGIIGCIKESLFIKKCISRYESLKISSESDLGQITIPRIITDIYRKKYDYCLNFDMKIVQDGIVIYPFTFFYPLPYENKEDIKQYKDYLSSDSFAVHLWSSSWIVYSEFYYLRKREYKKGLQIVFKNIFSNKNTNIKYLKKIFSCFKESISYKNE